MDDPPPVRIQVCGRLAVRLGNARVEDHLPSRQGRLLFAYLVLERRRVTTREELLEAVWPVAAPAAPDAALRALLSKLRGALGPEVVTTGAHPRLCLPADAFVDVEAALEALHRAESAVARGDHAAGWAPARVALHTTERELLPGERAPWVVRERRRLDAVRLRALDAVAAIGLGLGGAEAAAAERSGRRLVELAPLRESGWAWLMRAHAARGDVAEALLAYEQIRVLLRDELGVAPAEPLQRLHGELLAR